MVDYNSVLSMRGASFWSNVKDFFSDVGHGIKKAYDTVAPVVKEVLPYAMAAKKMLGYGAYSGGAKKRVVRRKASKKGSAYSGGAKKRAPKRKPSKKGGKRKASKRKASKRKGSKRAKRAGKGGILYDGNLNDVLYGGDLIDRDMMSQGMDDVSD